MEFYQEPPNLSNTFRADPILSSRLQKRLPPDVWKQVSPHLRHVGELAATQWKDWSEEAERQIPELVSFDPWGRRIDHIHMSASWKNLEAAAATEGIVAIGYEREFGEWSRVYQAAVLMLFHPSSAFVSCPLAMTDGAARAIELYGDEFLKKNAFQNLTSRDPKTFWTSGQWMTEKTGGSDVSGTSTLARQNGTDPEFPWLLDGTKWFTSATTSQMAMLLARPEGAASGSRGLSLFYTELRNEKSELKNIEILRLKDKLGTKALPTAELRLKGTPARLLGGEGDGVKKISSLFNLTRVYNSICALGQWRRALDLAWNYAKVRTAFGKTLMDLPLHRKTLEDLEADYSKAFELTFFVAHLLGKDECGTATEDERGLLRALTPIVKLWTAKKCVAACSEVVESFGGAGYIEDVGVAKLLRDAQVLSIWEGTTNVLALDFLRALEKENAAVSLGKFVESAGPATLKNPKEQERWQRIQDLIKSPSRESEARELCFEVAELVAEIRLSELET